MRHLLFVLIITFFIPVSALSSVDGGQEESNVGGTLHNVSLMSSSMEESSEKHKFFDDLSTKESFPVWELFVPAWQQNFQRRYRLWDDLKPAGLAFSEECQSDCEGLEISADIQQGEIVTKPISPKNLTLKLTDASLVSLENAGVPKEVLIALKHIKNRSFDGETLFADALLKMIGKKNLEEYREVVLQHSYVDKTLNSPWTLAYLKKVEEQDNSRQWEAWNDLLLSYGEKSKSLPMEKKSGRQLEGASASERAYRQTWLYQLRDFCDKWGLPRPRTLLLLLFLVYLTASLIKNFVRSRQ
ncbi:MAG: hypothetical protein GY801_24925 [bacterium]|nr:hypothetical protein [bacterium]